MEGIKELTRYLPEGWKEAARETGALIRGRNIKTPEELLGLNVLHLTQGGSFGITAGLLSLATKTQMSKQSVYERVQKSWRWMRWMTQRMCRENQFAMEKPEWLEKEVIAVDASKMSAKGSMQGDWCLHCAFDVFGFNYRSCEVTGIEEGETLSRHMIQAGDIVLADRVYGSITGMEHVLASGGDFVLRYRTQGFNVYDSEGNKIDLLSRFSELAPMESMSVQGFYYSKGHKRPVRIVAMRKEPGAAATAQRKMTRKMSKQRGTKPSSQALEMNNYIVLATSLDYSEARILELYRARWQIEQVFLRLKELFSLGDIPSRNPDSVKAWLYGKLFLAVLSETILKRECFSPEEKTFMRTLGVVQLVERP